MHLKGFLLIAFILFSSGSTVLKAQSMHVQENAGTQSTYSLSEIRTMSFSSDQLIIHRADSSSDEYLLSDIQYLSFSDSIAVSNGPENVNDHGIKMYPNPVSGVLNIDLSGAANKSGIIYVLSVEGKLLITQRILGPGPESVDMSHLPRGIYICRFQSEAETIAVKIIKQ